jgi:apolipoprotein N-acyltransferase
MHAGEQAIEKVSPVQVIIAVGLGGVSGLLAVLAWRVPLLGWLILVPLTFATYLYSPVAASLAGAVAGALAVAPTVGGIPRWAQAGVITINAVCWGVVFGLAAWVWPPRVPAWGAVIMPVAALVLSALVRFLAPPGYGGGSRFADCFLRSQQRWLPVVHVARLGSDLVIPPLLGLAASVPVMLLVQLPPSGTTAAVAGGAALVVAGALWFGFASYRRTIRRVPQGQSLRVAAVSVDDPFNGYARSPAYRDVEARIAKYQPHVAHVAAQGAQLIVLPEHAVIVTAHSKQRWLEAVSQWARHAKAILVTGIFDDDVGRGQLVIADETGAIVATYEKQHPIAGAEPRRKVRMPPALLGRDPFPVSAVICHDGNFNDLVRPVARAGGLLAIPANDWKEIEQLHSPSVVWVAVMTGVPLIRSTGHGRSVVFDAAGRLVAMASSFDGPVELVADVPIGAPHRGTRSVTASARQPSGVAPAGTAA